MDLLHLLGMHIVEVRSELELWDSQLPEVGKYHAQVESTGVRVSLDVQLLERRHELLKSRTAIKLVVG